MSKKLKVQVPETVTAAYFVSASKSVEDARDLAMSAVDEKTRWLIQSAPDLVANVTEARAEPLDDGWPTSSSAAARRSGSPTQASTPSSSRSSLRSSRCSPAADRHRENGSGASGGAHSTASDSQEPVTGGVTLTATDCR